MKTKLGVFNSVTQAWLNLDITYSNKNYTLTGTQGIAT